MNNNFLFDISFLKRLYEQNNIEKFVKIISLNIDETPQEEITGRAISGSINIDGASSMRRTCQLSLICGDRVVTDAYWGLRTLFRVYIGITNEVDSQYDSICWFPQGVFLITDFSNNYDESGLKINITGKDKMARLNGDCGGVLPVNLNIDELGVEGLKQKAKIYDIIREAVHVWGQEPYHNIIINDVPNNAYNILEYRVNNMQIQIVQAERGMYSVEFTPNDRDPVNDIYGYGDTIGYQFTDFVYPGTKSAAAGQPVTTGILDPIVQLLGNYEYYYDVYGRFIFQQKRNYLNSAWSPYTTVDNNELILPGGFMYTSPYSYEFDNATLVSSYQRSPKLSNIKNDFIVWGTKKTISGSSIPIHMRLSIDDKPSEETIPVAYHPYLESPGGWRHALYRMALDNIDSSYSIYYPDLISFWDNLYTVPNEEQLYTAIEKVYKEYKDKDNRYALAAEIYDIYSDKERGKNNYFETLKFLSGYDTKENNTKSFWHYNLSCFDTEKLQPLEEVEVEEKKVKNSQKTLKDVIETSNWKIKFKNNSNNPTIQDVINPEELIFWLDIIDNKSEISQFKISNIGLRSKVTNDKDVTAISYRETPYLIFYFDGDEEIEDYNELNGNTFVNVPKGMQNYFYLSTIGTKTAFSLIEEYMYNHLYYADTVSINSIPLYHIEPNTKILINNAETGISGDYILNSISIPFAHDELTSISASKSVDRLY